jgi:hypothetical protein
MTVYLIKLVAAFVRSKILHKNTVWPVKPVLGEAKRLARLNEDFKKIFAEAEGYVGFEKAHGGLLFGDAEDIACIRKMRARLALLEEGGHNE